MNTYKHIGKHTLPDYLTITIKQVGDGKRVYFNSTIHVDKVCECSVSFSNEYTDSEILNESKVFDILCQKYSLALITRLELVT